MNGYQILTYHPKLLIHYMKKFKPDNIHHINNYNHTLLVCYILNTNKFVLNLVSKEWISVNDIVLSNTNKFEIVSSISRLIYFEKKLIKKEKGEINLKTNISIKKR